MLRILGRTVVAGTVIILLTLVFLPPYGPATGLHVTNLAVMPFSNLLGDADSDYLIDGLTDSLITDLTAIGVRTVPRQTVMHYRGQHVQVPDIVRELKVDAVIEGSVIRSDRGFVVNVQLIDGRNARGTWGRAFVRVTREALESPDDIVTAVASEVGHPIPSDAVARLGTRRALDPEARDAFLRGRFLLGKRDLRAAIRLLSTAVRLEPDYSRAWASLAMAYAAGEAGSDETADIAQGQLAAATALRLEPTLSEALAASGRLRMRKWQWDEAEREATQALEGGHADPTAYQWLGTLLLRLGKCDEALAYVKAGAQLDPIAPIVNEAIGSVFMSCGESEKAIEPLRVVIEMYPDIVRSNRTLGSAYAKSGQVDRALIQLRRAAEMDLTSCESKATLAQVLGISGHRAEAWALIREIERAPEASSATQYCLAVAYAGLGDSDRVFGHLDRAVESHSALADLLLMEWRFDPFRADPRYASLLHRVGLLRYAPGSQAVALGPRFVKSHRGGE